MLMFNNSVKWFTGIVENREDPLMLGRVQVRIHGIHPSLSAHGDIQGLPTEDLLWITPVQDITSAAISGIGQSPTGIVEGSMVFGLALDERYLNCVILGTIAGQYTEKPLTTEGFCDPSGAYPRYIGNDVNILARGGINPETGQTTKPDSVYIRDENTGVAVNPDDEPLDQIPVDDNPDFTIEKMLRGDEGYREKWYLDSEGYPTIGIGHLIIYKKTSDLGIINNELSKLVGREVTNGRLTAEEVSKVFADDIEKTRRDMRKHPRIAPVYNKCNASRRMALENMAFQMGVGGLGKFKNSLAAMLAEEWKQAYDGLRQSVWANQTPGRSSRVSKIILTGNLESYGVIAPKKEESISDDPRARLRNARIAAYKTQRAEEDPEAPFTPQDTRIMFKEPKSSYSARYPYNHVYESESGHIIEIDDTPSHERYHRKHPSGTFEETRPDGTRVEKIEGDDYLIVKQGRKVNVKGNLQVVVEGDAQVYYMGNVMQTVDGNVTEFIRGNVNQTVEGTANMHVVGDVIAQLDANLTANVKGNAELMIDGNTTETIKGNYDLTVEGNFNMTVNGTKSDQVNGDWSRNCGASVKDIASGTVKIDGSRIDLG